MLQTTVVGDYINTMKTTFDLNFYLYQSVNAARIHMNIEVKRSCQIKKAFVKFEFLKSLLTFKTLNKSSSLYRYNRLPLY